MNVQEKNCKQQTKHSNDENLIAVPIFVENVEVRPIVNSENSNTEFIRKRFLKRKIKRLKRRMNKLQSFSMDIRDSEMNTNPSILIGPQNSDEVNLPVSWNSNIKTVDDALNAITAWTTSISGDINMMKSELSDISSNIQESLSGITELSDIDLTSKISALRSNVNGLQKIIRKLYTKF